MKLAAATPLILGAPTVFASRHTMKDRIAGIIREYSEQGIHRTGTTGDLENADWLVKHIRFFGLEPELDSFDFRRVRTLENTVAIGGKVAEAVPLYDCTFTDAQGISGSLGEIGSDADIGVVTTFRTASSPGGQVLMQARKLAFDTLTQHQLKPAAEIGPGQRPLGEARNIFDGGGRYISLLGRNGLFHHPSDTWPQAVDLEKTHRWIGAFTEIAVKL